MKTNGYHLYEHSLAANKAKPLGTQLSKLMKHRDTCQRRLNRLLKLNHVAAGDNRVGGRGGSTEEQIRRLEHVILQNNFDIVKIQSQMKSYNKNASGFDVATMSQFNRQAVMREKKVHPDKGRILFSKTGRYDVDEHSGAVPKERLLVTNPIIPPS